MSCMMLLYKYPNDERIKIVLKYIHKKTKTIT